MHFRRTLTMMILSLALTGHYLSQPSIRRHSSAASITGQNTDVFSRYKGLVDRAKMGDPTVDFVELIAAYWDIEKRPTASERPAMVQAFNDKDYRRAVDLAEKVLDLEFHNRNLHTVTANAYRELGDSVQETVHRNWAEQILNAMLSTGDGKTLQTAFCVQGVNDEYQIMSHFGYKTTGQACIVSGQIDYHRLDGTEEKTGNAVSLYFDISGHFSRCVKNKK